VRKKIKLLYKRKAAADSGAAQAFACGLFLSAGPEERALERKGSVQEDVFRMPGAG